MKKFKKELKLIGIGVLILFIFGLLFENMSYKLKYREEKELFIKATADTSDLREVVQLRVDKLEKVAMQNSRIFGYGQTFIKDIYDVGNTEVDKEIDSIPDNWWALRLEKAKENHGIKDYDLRYPEMCWPVEVDTAYVAFRECEFAYKRPYRDKNGVLRYYTHTGLDIANGESKKIVAMDNGIVVATGTVENKNSDYYGGQFIVIETEKLFIRYFHLNTVEVEEGDIVEKEQRIAIMGNTGEWSKGEHLHLEFIEKKTGKFINPVINSTWGFPVVELL
jgi:hypothetical protein